MKALTRKIKVAVARGDNNVHLGDDLQNQLEHALCSLRGLAQNEQQRCLSMKHVLPHFKHNNLALLHAASKVGIVELNADGSALSACWQTLGVKPRQPLRIAAPRNPITGHVAFLQVALKLSLECVVLGKGLLEESNRLERSAQRVLEQKVLAEARVTRRLGVAFETLALTKRLDHAVNHFLDDFCAVVERRKELRLKTSKKLVPQLRRNG